MRHILQNIISTFVMIVLFSAVIFAKDPGINAFYEGDFKKAEDYYDARLKKDKENEKILYKSGTSALAKKDLEKAKSRLTQSLATDNKSQLAKAHYNLGQLSLQEQNTEEVYKY